MAKLRMTFEVDSGQLFDTIAKMPDNDATMIGERIVGAMLTGEASFRDALGMGVYGVTLLSVEKLQPEQTK